MPIAPHPMPTFQSLPLHAGDAAAFVNDFDREDGLEAARGIVTGLFMSTLFWAGMSLAL